MGKKIQKANEGGMIPVVPIEVKPAEIVPFEGSEDMQAVPVPAGFEAGQ